jgi:tetratricopeptide (TPR) repeat protein
MTTLSSSNNHNPIGSPHRDVLEAEIPVDDAGKERLVTEIKNRAKAAVAVKAWADARVLYQKALQVCPKDAALHANLSLCQYSMGNWEDARRSAQSSVEADSGYVKGHWRLAAALVKMDLPEQAMEAHRTALKYEPNNKAIQNEMDKLAKVVRQQKKEQNDTMEVEPTTPTASDLLSETTVHNQKDAAQPKQKQKPNSATKEQHDEEHVGFTKSEHVKGYKIVNGKKTSYFHNELSEKDKQLIGDIAPKRIEADPAPVAAATIDGASAWNKAGTWEEKNVTVWATHALRDALKAVTYELPASSPAPGAAVRVTSVKSCDGHASLAMVRGKKRYIYEYSLQIEWKLETQGHDAEGTMSFPDVDGTCEPGDGYDMTDYTVRHASSPNLTPLLDRFVKNGGFRETLHEAIDNWVRLFKETY